MSSRRSDSALHLDLQPSRRFALLLALPYLLALAALTVLTIPWWLAAAMAFLLLAAAREALRRHALLTAPEAIAAATLKPSGAWVVTTIAGERLEARLRGRPFVLTNLVIVELRLETRRSASLILVPAMVPTAALRRLRIRLRHLGAVEDEPHQAI